jgi:hypothetical protein
MLEVDIVVSQGENVSGYSLIDFLGVAIVEEIGVVYEDLDRMFSSAEQVSPVC